MSELIKEEKQLDGSLKDLVKIKRHLINLFLMTSFWSLSSFGMYLVNYSLKNISGDFFKNNLLSAVIDVPISILSGFLYQKFGLSKVLSAFFFASMAGGITIVLFSESNPSLVPIMVAFAKGGVKVNLDICYLGNSFLFPSIFAGTAFGICNAAAKISTILSPLLAEAEPPVPMIIFSILAAIGSVTPMFLRKGPVEGSKNH